MKKEKVNLVVIVPNIVCAVLLLAMVALLFLPTWQYEDGMLSAGAYIGFPTEKIMLLKGFKDSLGLTTFPSVNDVVTIPVLSVLFAAVAVVVAILSRKMPLAALVALIGGAVCTVGYAVNPFFALGNTYMVLIVVSAVTAVAGLVGIILYAMQLVKKIKAEKAAQ